MFCAIYSPPNCSTGTLRLDHVRDDQCMPELWALKSRALILAAIVISCHFGLLLYEYMDMFILLVVF